jgi:hypothetical protein
MPQTRIADQLRTTAERLLLFPCYSTRQKRVDPIGAASVKLGL